MSPIALKVQPTYLNGPLTEFVRDRADEWFRCPRLRQARVELVSRDRRRVSVLYRLKVATDGQQHRLVAKQYWDWLGQHSSRQVDAQHAPPRLFARVDIDDKAAFEYATLATICEHFDRVADPRFKAVRPLGFLAEERTIVMEDVDAISLERLTQRCHRLAFHNPPGNLCRAMQHAGGWLRQFHELPPLSHTRARHTRRDEFLDSIRRVIAFLNGAVENCELPSELADRISAIGDAELPVQFPLGLSHTDFAPRNVLVDGEASVCVIDTLGRWQAPVYEDIGYFLFNLQASAVQTYSQGWWLSQARLREFEQAFLAGYFGSSPFPQGAVRLFQLQALLYRWAAIVHSSQRPRGVRRLPIRCRLVATNRFFGRYLRHLLKDFTI